MTTFFIVLGVVWAATIVLVPLAGLRWRQTRRSSVVRAVSREKRETFSLTDALVLQR